MHGIVHRERTEHGERVTPGGSLRGGGEQCVQRVRQRLAEACGARSEPAKSAFAVLEAMRGGGHPEPTLDFGLVTLCLCLELPPASAACIFAVGRSAGWVAHALEQRAAGYLLRPRARYVAS
jgi:citrate synthase